MAEVKLDELENYDAENLQEERNDFVGDNGADADQMMEDPVRLLKNSCKFFLWE